MRSEHDDDDDDVKRPVNFEVEEGISGLQYLMDKAKKFMSRS